MMQPKPLKVRGFAQPHGIGIDAADPNEVTVRFLLSRTASELEIKFAPAFGVTLEEGRGTVDWTMRVDHVTEGIQELNSYLDRIEDRAIAAEKAIRENVELVSDALKRYNFDV